MLIAIVWPDMGRRPARLVALISSPTSLVV